MGAKKREGMVYSTNPDFVFQDESEEQKISLLPNKQLLYVWVDSKGRNGKTVTLIKGFKGSNKDLEDLAGTLKRHCGTGGSVKDGDIIIQGDCRNKVLAFLTGKGYKTKKAGG
jgi:translation initiation factor 1